MTLRVTYSISTSSIAELNLSEHLHPVYSRKSELEINPESIAGSSPRAGFIKLTKLKFALNYHDNIFCRDKKCT